MTRTLVPIPFIWGIIGASETLNESTPVALTLLIAGIGASFTLAWWARGERDKISNEIKMLKCEISKLQCVKDKQCSERNDDAH